MTIDDPAAQRVALNFEDMRERLGDDEELVSDVIRLFLDDYRLRLDAIGSAIEARDSGRLLAAAHTLKGGASNLSAAGVVDAARALEAIGRSGDLTLADARFVALVSEMEHLAAALREIQAGKS